ncbi:hypothetical protein GQX73_g2242 [Xylaria multiplex]|uniref:Beta-lactamase-related domain-containing protein n=1 Tax=Xylaria multiplex TaxID=323545 RepID=A0A7C8MQQ1_9PEZI|nr:hypothetical protein GQX73_g2242 [Xylaria multiplex]
MQQAMDQNQIAVASKNNSFWNTTELPDYLKVPGRTQPSFHCRDEEPSRQKNSANINGYPIPGIQSPTAVSVMAQDYFVTESTWSNIIDHGVFDYIVIGSGFTALAFIDKTLELDPWKKILCIERGDFWLPTHFQNLPLPFKMVLGGASETFPWTLSRKTFETKEIGFCHGSCPFFGGRSTFWSAWCPRPTAELMRDFPESMLNAAKEQEFWDEAETLLNVVSADNIDNGIFAGLQEFIDKRLQANLSKIPSARNAEPALLAVGRSSPTSILRFNKFSVPGPMLEINERQRKLALQNKGSPLELMTNCTVTKMGKDDDGVVRYLETNRGVLSWASSDTKVILCAGAFPNATMLLNSFYDDCHETVGKRVTGHFLTHIAARCPVRFFKGWDTSGQLEIAATYLDGTDPETGKQYHVQVTAIHSPNPENDAEDAARQCPDYAAAATYEQLKGSENHVVFVCASLGEFTEDNENNYLKRNNTSDPSCNVTLQYTLHSDDRKLWDTMDKATYETIEAMCNTTSQVEYWDTKAQKWTKSKPSTDMIRIPGVVHETSTAFVGHKKDGGSLDENYRPHGIKNVHVTGGATFPTSGSWNPTLTMCGFAQDLARKLHRGECEGDTDILRDHVSLSDHFLPSSARFVKLLTAAVISRLLDRLQGLGAIISQICDIAGTPGLSLGVLHHGQMIHQANFGLRDVEARLSPDEHTVYVLGSLTKAITAAMIGILVDEGKLSWTTQLQDVLPAFHRAKYDPTNNITITDLLSHRTGLPSYDSLWLLSDNRIPISREDAISILSYVPVAADLRTELVYNNMAYEVLGRVIEHISGTDFSSFLTSRILRPLGMNETFYTSPPLDLVNVAKPYTALQNASVFPVPSPIYGEDVLMGPAGGIRSSVHDILLLYNAFIDAANSQIGGAEPIISQNPLRQLGHIWQGRISLPLSTVREASYASGWLRMQLPAPVGLGRPSLGPILGEGMPSRLGLFHEGSLPGYTTFAALFPETSSAVVVLSNSLGLANSVELVGRLLIEELFGNTVNTTEYIEYATRTARERVAAMPMIKRQLMQNRSGHSPVNPLKTYVGTYCNSINTFFIKIREEKGYLRVHFMGLDSEGFDLQPYQYNSFFWYLSHDELSQRARYTVYPKEYYVLQFGWVSDGVDTSYHVESDTINAVRWKHEFAVDDKGEIFRRRDCKSMPFGQDEAQLVVSSKD